MDNGLAGVSEAAAVDRVLCPQRPGPQLSSSEQGWDPSSSPLPTSVALLLFCHRPASRPMVTPSPSRGRPRLPWGNPEARKGRGGWINAHLPQLKAG